MKWSRGFTLIEAVLSLGILSVGLIGVMYAFQGMGTSALLADQTVIASNISRGALENVIASRNANGYAAALAAIQNGNFNQNPATNYPLNSYTLTVTTYEVDPDKDAGATDDFLDAMAGSGYARVTSTVSWNNGQKTVSLVTVMANH